MSKVSRRGFLGSLLAAPVALAVVATPSLQTAEPPTAVEADISAQVEWARLQYERGCISQETYLKDFLGFTDEDFGEKEYRPEWGVEMSF